MLKNKAYYMDKKDEKILSCLIDNARMSFSMIGRKVRLSKDSVRYRINNMEQKGVINGYTALLNVHKLGYVRHHLLVHLSKFDDVIKRDLIEKAEKYDFIHFIKEFSGKYDLEIGFVAKTPIEADSYISRILKLFKDNIKEYELIILTENYINNNFPFHKSTFKGNNVVDNIELDQIDKEIIKLLLSDSRRNLYEIGEKVGLSSDAVNYRLKNLKKIGVIDRFIPSLDLKKVGYTVYTVAMDINFFDDKKLLTFKSLLETNKNVLWAVKSIGAFNILMYLAVKDSSDLHKTINQIRNLFFMNLNSYEILVSYKTHKYTYLPEICLNSY